MRLLNRFEKVNNITDIPIDEFFFVLTRSTTFLGKAIQGFMRLAQWLHITKDTHHVPNHGDIVYRGMAIGALEKGVEINSVQKHFKTKPGTEYFIVRMNLTEDEKIRLWNFATKQVGEPYKYFDLLRHIKKVFTRVWSGKQEELDRDAWTCISLLASAYQAATGLDIFGDDLEGITPYEFSVIIDKETTLFY